MVVQAPRGMWPFLDREEFLSNMIPDRGGE